MVSKLYPSRDDASIIKTAYKEERIIVTNDKDFGYLIFKAQFPPPSIILFRFKEEIQSEKINAIKTILNLPAEKILNHFVVASENKIRIRPLER
jgi:predicted nuclease of predicted toxin-antitoxin system